MKKGKVIVIVAPSGAGKSTLIKRLKKDNTNLLESISFTTRAPRDGEVDGTHYFFVSKDDFIAKRDENEFLEWAEVHSNLYGTSKKFVEKQINDGHSLIFDIDVQGADAFKGYFKDDAKVVFIAPPSIEELESRLTGRGTDSDETIALRINNAKSEMTRQDDYDYCVVNDDLDVAYENLKIIIESILKE